MSEELTPAQKVQAEYNRAVSLLGHNRAQQLNLVAEQEKLESQIKKIINKAQNIPKEKIEEAKEEIKTEEVQDAVAS